VIPGIAPHDVLSWIYIIGFRATLLPPTTSSHGSTELDLEPPFHIVVARWVVYGGEDLYD